jgi:hypothetical protein
MGIKYKITWLTGEMKFKPPTYETRYSVRREPGWWNPWTVAGRHECKETGWAIVGEIGNFHTKRSAERRKTFLEANGIDLIRAYQIQWGNP